MVFRVKDEKNGIQKDVRCSSQYSSMLWNRFRLALKVTICKTWHLKTRKKCRIAEPFNFDRPVTKKHLELLIVGKLLIELLLVFVGIAELRKRIEEKSRLTEIYEAFVQVKI